MTFTPDSKFLIATLGRTALECRSTAARRPRSRSRPTSCRRSAPRCEFQYAIPDSATFVVKQIRDAVPSPDGEPARIRRDGPPVRDGLSSRHAAAAHQLDATASSSRHGAPTGSGSRTRRGPMPTAGTCTGCAATAGTPQRLTHATRALPRPAYSLEWTAHRRRARPGARARRSTEGAAVARRTSSGSRRPAVRRRSSRPPAAWRRRTSPRDTDAIFAYGGGRGLVSMRWDGTDVKTHVRVVGGAAAGRRRRRRRGAAGDLVLMAPDGDQALAQVSSDRLRRHGPVLGGTEPTITVGGTRPDAGRSRRAAHRHRRRSSRRGAATARRCTGRSATRTPSTTSTARRRSTTACALRTRRAADCRRRRTRWRSRRRDADDGRCGRQPRRLQARRDAHR